MPQFWKKLPRWSGDVSFSRAVLGSPHRVCVEMMNGWIVAIDDAVLT